MNTAIRLEIQRVSGLDVRRVKSEGHVGIAAGACPGCKAEPFYVKGSSLRPNPNRPHDEKMSDGRCVSCGDPVGYIFARVSTIFGIEEDERVCDGAWRVY
jgi:hypothetical protein